MNLKDFFKTNGLILNLFIILDNLVSAFIIIKHIYLKIILLLKLLNKY